MLSTQNPIVNSKSVRILDQTNLGHFLSSFWLLGPQDCNYFSDHAHFSNPQVMEIGKWQGIYFHLVKSYNPPVGRSAMAIKGRPQPRLPSSLNTPWNLASLLRTFPCGVGVGDGSSKALAKANRRRLLWKPLRSFSLTWKWWNRVSNLKTQYY